MGENNRVMGVLKCCNQSVLAPAVLRLKSSIGSAFPYKDIRGGWRIFVHINTDQVVIQHRLSLLELLNSGKKMGAKF